MQTFELIFNKLEELFIECLPEYIRKINETHNDGIILKAFENKNLLDNCNKVPSFLFCMEEANYEEKDRILENTVFEVSFKLTLQPHNENNHIEFWRYVEAVSKMIDETETDGWNSLTLEKEKHNTIYLRIVV